MTQDSPRGEQNGDADEGALPSQHESGTSPPGSQPEDPAREDRPARGERSGWHEDLPGPSRGDASDAPGDDGRFSESSLAQDDAEGVLEPELVQEADRLVPLVLAKLENHLHLPIQPPDPDALADLKKKDPEAHRVWLREVAKQMDHQRFMESARYRMPLNVIRTSQVVTLLALLAVLGLAAYALYLDHAWIATLFGALDVAAILTVFTDIGRSVDEDDD